MRQRDSIGCAGRGASVVTMICDGGERYLDTYYDDDWLARNGFDLAPHNERLEAFMRTGELPGGDHHAV